MDLSPEEGQVMMEHGAYWRSLMARGHVIAFGLVGDPGGAFGIGILQAESAEEARTLMDADPTVQSGRGFSIDILPMPRGVVHAGSA